MATVPQEEGRSFAYLESTPFRKFLGVIYACFDVFLFCGLIILLGLFVDFLTNQGKIPHLSDLPLADQKSILTEWKNYDADYRRKIVQEAGFDFPSPDSVSDPEASRKNALLYRLIGKEVAPLVLEASADDLQKWARQNGPINDPYWSALLENELRWQILLRTRLQEKVSNSAAESIHVVQKTSDNPTIQNPVGPLPSAGVISLLARNTQHWSFPLLALKTRFSPWLTSGSELSLNTRYLLTLFACGLLLTALRFGVSILINRHAARLTLHAVTNLRRGIYHHCHRLGNLSLVGDGTSGASTLFIREVEAVQDEFFVRYANQYRYTLYLIALPILALAAQFWLTLAALLIGLVAWMFLNLRLRSLAKKTKESSRRAKAWLSRLTESLKIMRLVRSYSMQTFNQSRLERQLADYEREQLQRYRQEGSIRPTVFLFLCSLTFLVLFLAGVISLNQPIGAFALTVVVSSLLCLYYPLRSFVGQRKYRRKADLAEQVLQKYFDRQSKVKDIVDGEFLDVVRKNIRFEDVSLSDQEERKILRHLELTIPAGSRVGIVGPDEIQKKSLLYLIMRLNDPKAGSVRMDGKDLKWVSKDSLRMQVGVILQDHLVFNDTVANNIGCGDPNVTLPQIIEAGKLAHAHQFIQKLPHGYETVIGEFGHSLSIGQLYRIALARCILRDPSVLLIEEPVIPLDDETKELLDDSEDRFLQKRTVIYLPHRISTLKSCDMLHLVNEGRIEASAKHRDLLHESPLYKHLYYMEFNQFGESN
ncbi:ABC transporter ATP-binding protein [Telmatocola sphagniphila]|uniref:ABC transporter ATP-binding protein n=1 Tax=Telmatocola sphagniphila TaxID=1123043 RepID=A0A8E6B9U8_9BACT|nr:ABC transporter ATP-binding protein [Telmatocola sphagniphila]QVL34396.1 ABC transporter ATP-binding protein [Telmatocola sphagniphila]